MARRAPLGFGEVLLIYGPEGFLADRAATGAVNALRSTSPDVEVSEVDCTALDVGRFVELTGPSLFADQRVLVATMLENLPSELHDTVLGYAEGPSDGVAVILVHSGGQKGRGLLDKLKRTSIHTENCTSPKPWELPRFVAAEIAALGGQADDRAANALVDAVGHDLRALASACSQLVDDCDGRIDPDAVGRYFGGRADVTSFAVADAALAGRVDGSLEQLRWALDCGVPPVLLTSAMAGGLRGLARFISAPQGLREGDLAREVGVAPWKLKTLRTQARGWAPGGLAAAIKLVAQTDADVKGASDAGYALDRMVLGVCQAHGRGRRPGVR